MKILLDENIAVLSKSVRKTRSELIRDAIDQLIDQSGCSRRELVLLEAAGIWKDRKDLPDYKSIRADWDRN